LDRSNSSARNVATRATRAKALLRSGLFGRWRGGWGRRRGCGGRLGGVRFGRFEALALLFGALLQFLLQFFLLLFEDLRIDGADEILRLLEPPEPRRGPVQERAGIQDLVVNRGTAGFRVAADTLDFVD
jgi:hypothetical protein